MELLIQFVNIFSCEDSAFPVPDEIWKAALAFASLLIVALGHFQSSSKQLVVIGSVQKSGIAL